jgi:hypothetical protein
MQSRSAEFAIVLGKMARSARSSAIASALSLGPPVGTSSNWTLSCSAANFCVNNWTSFTLALLAGPAAIRIMVGAVKK